MSERSDTQYTIHNTRKKGRLFIISAPSGCGKTTLCNRLLADNLGLMKSVSMTTRPPRPDERDGVDYRFISRREFEAAVSKKGFIEHEENFGYLYGTPKRFVRENLKKGVDLLLNIDVKGAMKVRRAYPKESVLIFIQPPSMKALEQRLRSRKTEPLKTIASRLEIARREMSYKDRYGHVIVNDNLDKAYGRLREIITANRKG